MSCYGENHFIIKPKKLINEELEDNERVDEFN